MNEWKQEYHYADEGWIFFDLIIEPAADGLSHRVGVCPSCRALVFTGWTHVGSDLEVHIESLHHGRTQSTEGLNP